MTRDDSSRRRNLSRREFLTRGGVIAGGVAFGPALLGQALAGAGTQRDVSTVGGKLAVLNWPLYIDKKSKKDFVEDTGIKLKYSEGFNDNNEFFAKYQEQFADGDSIGFDIVIPTSWLAKRLIDLGYVQKLPLDQIPNAANLSPGFQAPLWDPTGEYTLPWQTGMTGIAYNLDVTGRELTSVDDLFDKKFRRKIGVLSEMRDTLGLALLADGVDPATVTYKQAVPTFKRLQKAVDDGQIRRFTGNDYQEDLVDGNFAACVGWSGDVAQLTLDNENLRFVIPDEGGMRWADTMCWLETSKARDQVAAWMDYFYDPANAARVAAYVQFISPVDGIQAELAALDEASATNPLIFPPEDVQDRLHVFNPNLSAKDEERFDEAFADLAGA